MQSNAVTHLRIHLMSILQKKLAAVLAFTCCPTLALSISGGRVHVWLMYVTDKVYGSELFSIHLGGHDFEDTPNEIKRRAAMFQILRNAANDLCDFYANIHGGAMLHGFPHLFPQPALLLRGVRSQPNAAHLTLAGLDLIITDNVYSPGFPEDEDARLSVFKGVIGSSLGRYYTNVYIKFVASTYGENVHRLLAEKGWAPTLRWCGEIVEGKTMVVMDAVLRAHTPQPRNAQDIKLVEEKVGAIVEYLHDNDFVHGDLRAPNILIRDGKAAGDVLLIDFDWSERVGVARYPRALNPNIKWPDKVERLRRSFITKKDDTDMLQITLEELRNPKKSITAIKEEERPSKRQRIASPSSHSLSLPTRFASRRR